MGNEIGEVAGTEAGLSKVASPVGARRILGGLEQVGLNFFGDEGDLQAQADGITEILALRRSGVLGPSDRSAIGLLNGVPTSENSRREIVALEKQLKPLLRRLSKAQGSRLRQ